jgi:hypothetical protein
MSTPASEGAYGREYEIIAHFKALAEKETIAPEEASAAILDFCNHYNRLLDDSKIVSTVGDRLQRKIKGANSMLREQAEEIKRINGDLQYKNVQLQETIDELTRTKASRRATTFVLGIAMVIFILSELMEKWIEGATSTIAAGPYISWGFKIFLVLLFKPLETLLERSFMHSAKRRKDAELAAANAALAAEPAPAAKPVTERPGLRPRPQAAMVAAAEASTPAQAPGL